MGFLLNSPPPRLLTSSLSIPLSWHRPHRKRRRVPTLPCSSLFPSLSRSVSSGTSATGHCQHSFLSSSLPHTGLCLPEDQQASFFWEEKCPVALIPSSTKLTERGPSHSPLAQGSLVPASHGSWHHCQPCHQRLLNLSETRGRLCLRERRLSFQFNHPARIVKI